MQATPIIPAAPTDAALSAGSKAGGKSASDGQFRQHLSVAGKNSSNMIEQKNSVSTEVMPSTEKVDSIVDTIENIPHLAAGELLQSLPAEQGRQSDLPAMQGQQSGLFDLNTNKTAGTTQNPQILSLSNSVQIPGAPGSLEPGEKPTITLGSLLKKNVALINEQQKSDVSTSMTTATKPFPSQNHGQADLTIESWRAQFSYQRATGSQVAKNPTIAATQTQPTGEVVVKEPMLVYVTPQLEQVVTPIHAKGGSGVNIPNERQDVNSHFIHSNLPGITTKAEGERNNSSQQQTGEGQQKMTQEGTFQPEQATVTKAGQNTPLIFSLNQEGTPGFTPASQQTTASQMLRLPSGAEVQQSHIVDQVINRFTLNRTLESGTVVLRLHPAELGELRMEIKVEQDNIRAHITTQNPQVQELLDRHLPKLREALEQQGLNLDQLEVTVATDKDNNAQHFQEHFNRQQEGRPTRSEIDHVPFALDQEDLETEDRNDEQQSLSVLI